MNGREGTKDGAITCRASHSSPRTIKTLLLVTHWLQRGRGKKKGERKRNQAGARTQKVPSRGSPARSFTTEHIKRWIKAGLQGSWQLWEGAARTARTLFRQNLAEGGLKCGANPGVKAFSMGVCHSRERDHLHGHAWCREGALGAQTLGLWGAQGGEQSPKSEGTLGSEQERSPGDLGSPFCRSQSVSPSPFPPKRGLHCSAQDPHPPQRFL